MPSAPAIGFELKPSRHLALACAVMLLLAGLALWLSAVPTVPSLAVTAMLLVLGWHGWRYWRADRWRALALDAQGRWQLHGRDGGDHPATLLGQRVLGPYIVLQLECGGRRHGLLLGPDNLDADSRRRLRTRLAQSGRGAADGTRLD